AGVVRATCLPGRRLCGSDGVRFARRSPALDHQWSQEGRDDLLHLQITVAVFRRPRCGRSAFTAERPQQLDDLWQGLPLPATGMVAEPGSDGMGKVSLALLVLKTRQVETVRSFYSALGIALSNEQHGSGP